MQSRRHARPRRPLLLIIGDPARLEADRLLSHEWFSIAGKVLQAEPDVVWGTSTTALQAQLQTLQARARYQAIVVIAHSNESVVALTPESEEPLDWQSFAVLVSGLEPSSMAFVACKAGRTLATSALFETIESLEDVYASPLNMSAKAVPLVAALLPRMLSSEVSVDYVRAVKALQFTLTRGVLYHRTRADWLAGNEESDVRG